MPGGCVRRGAALASLEVRASSAWSRQGSKSRVLAIVAGIAAFAWPDKTFEALILLIGVYAFVRGCIWLSFGLLAATARERWWPFVVNGVIGISFGVLTFAEPQVMTIALVSVLGAWAVLTGVLEIVGGLQAQTGMSRRAWPRAIRRPRLRPTASTPCRMGRSNWIRTLVCYSRGLGNDAQACADWLGDRRNVADFELAAAPLPFPTSYVLGCSTDRCVVAQPTDV